MISYSPFCTSIRHSYRPWNTLHSFACCLACSTGSSYRLSPSYCFLYLRVSCSSSCGNGMSPCSLCSSGSSVAYCFATSEGAGCACSMSLASSYDQSPSSPPCPCSPLLSVFTSHLRSLCFETSPRWMFLWLPVSLLQSFVTSLSAIAQFFARSSSLSWIFPSLLILSSFDQMISTGSDGQDWSVIRLLKGEITWY